MKKVERKHIEATRFWVEQNEKGLTKTQVAEMFKSDRHKILQLQDTYVYYRESKVPEEQDFLFYFSKSEKQAMEEYINNPHSSKKAIAKKYGIGSTRTFDGWLKTCGYDTKRHYKFTYDRTAFDGKPSPEMAYWLGFLLADGYVGKRNKCYSVELHLGQKDRGHLIKFGKFLKMSNEQIEENIKETTGGAYTRDNIVYRFRVFSSEIASQVAKYNILPNKSLKEIPFIFQDESLQINYIRGIIDGDGYISCPDNKDKRIGVVGSEATCYYIANFFMEKFPQLTFTQPHRREIGKNGYYLWRWNVYNKQAVKAVISLLYTNADIYLDRKYYNACAVLKSLN